MVRAPIVAVFGATGAQGGSVVHHLLNSDRWHTHIRALTRDPEQQKAAALKSKGVDVVKADLTDRASLVKALTNVDTVFLMTDFYDESNRDAGEENLAVLAAEAAKEAGVENMIFSSLANIERATQGKYEVAHFTGKAVAAKQIAQMGFTNTVFVQPGFYWQNLHSFVLPKRQPDGSLAFMLPCSKETCVPGIDIRDFGGVVAKIVDEPGRYNGDTIPIASEYTTMEQIAQELAKALGIPTTFKTISDNEARKCGMIDEFVQMFRAFEMVGYYGAKIDFDVAHSLFPDLKNWRDYLLSINPEYVFERVLLGDPKDRA